MSLGDERRQSRITITSFTNRMIRIGRTSRNTTIADHDDTLTAGVCKLDSMPSNARNKPFVLITLLIVVVSLSVDAGWEKLETIMTGWKTYSTVDDIPASHFAQQKSIYGLVERVIDGDTIRVRHLPGYSRKRWMKQSYYASNHNTDGNNHKKKSKNNIIVPLTCRKISDQTLSIRLYGVDCPETSHFGKPAQAFAAEAKEFTKQLVLHRVVRITLLRKDQYQRAISLVEVVSVGGNNHHHPSSSFTLWWMSRINKLSLGIFFRSSQIKDVSLELARAGLAELYTGGGAEYCNNRQGLERCIERANAKRVGIWSLGKNRISAAEHKRHPATATATATANASSSSTSTSSTSTRYALAWATAPTQRQKVVVPDSHALRQSRQCRQGGAGGGSGCCPPRRGRVFDTALTGLELAVG